MEGCIFQFPDFDDPALNDPRITFQNPNAFFEEYNKRWPGDWGAVSWEYASILDLWKSGAEKAGSVEPGDVLAAMKEGGSSQHAFGEAKWWGKELFGIDNALVVVLTSLVVLYHIEHSRIGLTFHAVHWQDQLASSVGVDTRHYRTLALVIASFFAGLAGTLLAHYLGTVNPNRFDVEEMVFVLIWVIVGGTRTFLGPIVGVVVLTILNEVVLRELGTESFRPLIYGALLIASILFLPDGLESLPTRLRERFKAPNQDPETKQQASKASPSQP